MSHSPESKDGSLNEIIVHSILIADVEDPDIAVGEHLYKWEHTEAGKWIMENSIRVPVWRKFLEFERYEYRYDILAYLDDAQLTYWKLKYE